MVTKYCNSTNLLVQLVTSVASSDVEATLEFPPHDQTDSSTTHANESNKDISKLLTRIAKPKIWNENGKTYETRLSCKPASRSDVTNLCKKFDLLMLQRRAKVDGICPIRRELYFQLFDELIRQICLVPQSVERGIFFVKIRDECIMTLKSYEALLSSSVNIFAQNSISTAQKIKTDLRKSIAAIEMENKYLQKIVQQLEIEHEQAHQTYTDLLATLQDKHSKKIEDLSRTNMQLKLHLDAMSALKKTHQTIV